MARIQDIPFHNPITAYTYELDNKPLEALADNDVRLQEQLDEILARLFRTIKTEFTRNHFKQLRPIINQRNESELTIAPGSFICRMPTRSGPWDSDKPLGSGLNTRRDGFEKDRRYADTNEFEEYHRYGETQRTSVVFYPGGRATFEPWDDNDFNWVKSSTGASPDPADYRMDLVCVQGFPSDDQSGDNPTILGTGGTPNRPNLVVVKGAGWRNFPLLTSAGEYDFNLLNSAEWLGGDPNMLAGSHASIGIGTSLRPENGAPKYWDSTMTPSPGLVRAKTYARSNTATRLISPELTVATVPSPDDIINASFHVTPRHIEMFTSVTSGLESQSWAGTVPNEQVGLFCVPIAYVKIPKGYAGGHLREENVKDIRPLMRTAELTLSEREGIANTYKPSADNRILTVMDSDYTALVDYILRSDQWNRYELGDGQRNIVPGNHEGRLQAMEAAMRRPTLQTAPTVPYPSVPIPFSDGQNPSTYFQSRQFGENWKYCFGAGPKTSSGYKPYDPGLYWQAGQFVPCVRNYLNRFYTEKYDPRERAKNTAYGANYRIFGASEIQVRRLVLRDKFLSYSSEFPISTLPYQEFRTDWGGHYNGMERQKCMWPGQGPNVSRFYPARNRYKLQTVELDFIFPEFDPDRDSYEECSEVWRQGEKSGGWDGFGHGGSYDNARWVTVCQTVDDDKFAQTEVHMGFPPGWLPYWVDVDALGFAPGTIDSLQIQLFDTADYYLYYGQRIWFRFNKGYPRYYRNSDQPAYSYDDPLVSLDQRQRYITQAGSWSQTGTMGEHMRYVDADEESHIIKQLTYGYSGFVILMFMGGDTTPQKQIARPDSDYVQGPWKAKETKLKITGPAHTFYNGAFLPTAVNSDCGDTNHGQTWID